MREETQRLIALHELRRNLKRAKQTPENELVATRLDLEIEILEIQSSLAAAKLTLVLLDAWEKTGRFTVMRDDGVRRDGNPVVTGNPVQDFWNVRNEARSLAEWSLL